MNQPPVPNACRIEKREPRRRLYGAIAILGLLAAAGVAIFFALNGSRNPASGEPSSEKPRADALSPTQPPAPGQATQVNPVRSVVAEEELILALSPWLKVLSNSILNLKFPDHRARSLFADSFGVVDLAASTKRVDPERLGNLSVVVRQWPVNPGERQVDATDVSMWRSFLDNVDYFEHAKFYFIRGEFIGEQFAEFDSEIGLDGLARSAGGRWRAVRSKHRVRWRRDPTRTSTDDTPWRITRWHVTEFETIENDRPMFAESLDLLLPNEKDRQRVRESLHWRYLTRHFYPRRDAKIAGQLDDTRFFPMSLALHPGLAVVDVDRDGFDDLYVTVRWGKNMLLRNRGDGTFEEIAAKLGLDVESRSNAAVFADFDNDGDADLMLARGFERSMYLVNENGHFVDRSTELVASPLPFEATSVSAVDFNGDGLLDVYFSTYHQDDVRTRIDADLSHPDHRIHTYLTPAQSQELKRRHARENQPFLRQVGPPNILLVNRGDGRFEVAPESEQLAVWRNSFQGTWGDFDDDGDADLYVANDFSEDNLFRNDGPDGFVDVTVAQGIDAIGFAMGVSWGDYDNDGRQDLYVSNMYSKAGQRITGRLKQLDPRIRMLAEGNYLWRRGNEGFQLVSGKSPPKLNVARADWAWGGQFADLNNDGFLDIYVPSGNYTVPDEFSTPIDL